MNIIVSGLTAAGKTTHCLMLAERFGLRCVAVSDVLMNLAGIDSAPDSSDSSLWLSAEARRLEGIRKASGELDRAVDLELQRQCAENDNLVFDSWALPWLAAGSAVKIWLESSAESRVRKSIVSHLGHGLSDAAVGELVARKDREARELFLSLYKFDIFEDRSVFDLAVDISRFVAEPTPQMCRESIRRTGELLEAFVGWAVYREPGCRMDFARLVRDSVGQVRLADCWAQELSEG